MASKKKVKKIEDQKPLSQITRQKSVKKRTSTQKKYGRYESNGKSRVITDATILAKVDKKGHITEFNKGAIERISEHTGVSQYEIQDYVKRIVKTRPNRQVRPNVRTILSRLADDKVTRFLSNMGVVVEEFVEELQEYDPNINENDILNPSNWEPVINKKTGTINTYKIDAPLKLNGYIINFAWNYEMGSHWEIRGEIKNNG